MYQKMRNETEDWNDFKKLPEKITEFSLVRRLLHGEDYVVFAPQPEASETNERRMVKPCCNIHNSRTWKNRLG